MNICIPTCEERGLESRPYGHFGSAPGFLLHNSATGETRLIPNANEHHAHGACNPVAALAGHGVDALLVGGIGARALTRLRAAGIRVFQAIDGTAAQNLDALAQHRLAEFSDSDACQGHGHAHGPHPHG